MSPKSAPTESRIKLCKKFQPNPHYKPSCGEFCVKEYCIHWIPDSQHRLQDLYDNEVRYVPVVIPVAGHCRFNEVESI